jgi:hypothetical protein
MSFFADGGPSLTTSSSLRPVKLSRRRILQRLVRPPQRPRLLKKRICAEILNNIILKMVNADWQLIILLLAKETAD